MGNACTADAPDALECLESLEQAGVPYCLLKEPEPRRAPGSDVDFVVPAGLLPRRVGTILHQAAERGRRLVVQAFDHDSAWSFVVCPRMPRAGGDFTWLDAWPAPDVGAVRLYSGPELLASRRRQQAAFVPAAAVEFGCLLTRRLVKNDLRRRHVGTLAALWERDPAGCERELRRFWSPATAREIASLARAGAWDAILRRAPALRAALVRRAVLGDPLGTIGRVVRRLSVRTRHLAHPTNGVHVVFLGPDGAGKSTVMDRLRTTLGPAFSGVSFQGGAPSLRQLRDGSFRTRTVLPTARPGRPHGLPVRARVASILKAGYWFAYYVLGYQVMVRPALARGRLVLHHRYVVDALVDPHRYRYGGPRWLLRLLWRLTPKPDLVVLLDAPADVIRARKSELPRGEIERQLAEYRVLVRSMPSGHIVDAGQTLGRTVADTSAIILEFMAARTARRLGAAGREVA